MIVHKHVWGESWDVFDSPDGSIKIVGFRGYAGGRSTRHIHHKMKQDFQCTQGSFHVIHGESRTRLVGVGADGKPGPVLLVEAGVEHQLIFDHDAEGLETYYALDRFKFDPADIERLTEAVPPAKPMSLASFRP